MRIPVFMLNRMLMYYFTEFSTKLTCVCQKVVTCINMDTVEGGAVHKIVQYVMDRKKTLDLFL